MYSTYTANKLGDVGEVNFFHGIIFAAGMTEPFAITPSTTGLTFTVSEVSIFHEDLPSVINLYIEC